MTHFVAGAIAGLLLLLAFIAVAPVMVFSLARDADHWAGPFIRRANPTTLMLGLIVLAYPTWTLLGGLLGLLYRLSVQQAPGTGLGSGNLAYSLLLTLTALVVAVPAMLLLRKVAFGVLVIALAFTGIYGWVLPFLVHAAER